jgi:hypothetical protein
MAKDKNDLDTEDWVDDAEERREREIQEHARRVARRENREFKKGQGSAADRPRVGPPRRK